MPLTSGLQGGGSVRGGGGRGGGFNILLVVQAFDKASKELQRIQKNVEGLDKSTKQSGQSARQASSGLGSFASGVGKVGLIVGAVTVGLYALNRAFQEVLATGEQGAAFRQMQESFGQISESVGVTSDLLDQMREKSQNTISDFDLMSFAATALAGATGEFGNEMANALPHLVEIAKAANKANPALGSVDFQLQSLIIGLKRLSPRLIDNTGLQIKLGQAYEEYAKQLGKTREELTSQDQQQALLNATLEAGNRLLEQVGGTAESATDPYQRLRTASENLANVLAEALSPALGEVAEFLTDAIDAAREHIETKRDEGEALRDLAGDTKFASENYDRYVDAVKKAAVEAGKLAVTQEQLDSLLKDGTFTLMDMNNVVVIMGEEEAKVAEETRRVAEAMRIYEERMRGVTFASEEATMSQEELKNKLAELRTIISDPLGEAIDRFKEKQRSLAEEAAKVRDEIALMEGMPLTEKGQAELFNLRMKYEELRQQIIANAEAHDLATRKIIFDLAMQRAAASENQSAALELLTLLGQQLGIFGQETANAVLLVNEAFNILETEGSASMDVVIAKILQVKAAAEAAQGDYFINFHINMDTSFGGAAAEKGFRGKTPAEQAEDFINNMFPPGSFTPGITIPSGEVVSAEIEKPTKSFIEKILEVGNALSRMGDLLIDRWQTDILDPLEQEVENINALLGPAHIDMMAREHIVELEQQRADALQEIADAEEKILEFQRAQQQLQFLEQQLELLDLIREHGLNASDILGGLQLGLNADIGQVLDATINAMNAIIDQAEEELGISSPSSVFEEIGHRITEGLAIGIGRGISDAQMMQSRMLSAMLSPSGVMTNEVRASNGKTVVIEKLEITMPIKGINSAIDWEDGARRVAKVIKEKIV